MWTERSCPVLKVHGPNSSWIPDSYLFHLSQLIWMLVTGIIQFGAVCLGDQFKMLMTDSKHSKNHQYNEKVIKIKLSPTFVMWVCTFLVETGWKVPSLIFRISSTAFSNDLKIRIDHNRFYLSSSRREIFVECANSPHTISEPSIFMHGILKNLNRGSL